MSNHQSHFAKYRMQNGPLSPAIPCGHASIGHELWCGDGPEEVVAHAASQEARGIRFSRCFRESWSVREFREIAAKKHKNGKCPGKTQSPGNRTLVYVFKQKQTILCRSRGGSGGRSPPEIFVAFLLNFKLSLPAGGSLTQPHRLDCTHDIWLEG